MLRGKHLVELWRRQDSWVQLVCAAVSIRLVGGIFHAFAPITAPHTWRQVDTTATALRFALRWSGAGEGLPWWMPAVLNSGDTLGVMPMEFPLLNWLGAFGFLAAGSHVDLGRGLAQLVHLAVIAGVTALAAAAWRGALGSPRGIVSVIVASSLFSFASPYTAKFMPDLLALQLCLLGTAGLWRTSWWAVVPLSVGLLVKPTAGVAVGLLLLHPLYLRRMRFDSATFMRHVLMALLSLVPAGVWYVPVAAALKARQEREAMFMLHDRIAPWAKLKEFWSSAGVWDVLGFHSVFAYGWIIVLGVGLWLVFQKNSPRSKDLVALSLILLLQASLVGILSGDHARLHSYYLIGLAPASCLIIQVLWRDGGLRWLRFVLGIGLLVRTGEGAVSDTAGLREERSPAAWFADCKILRAAVPDAPWRQNYVWRTPVESYPILDLCLAERGQSLTSGWGLFRLDDGLPPGCEAVSTTKRLALVKCS